MNRQKIERMKGEERSQSEYFENTRSNKVKERTVIKDMPCSSAIRMA